MAPMSGIVGALTDLLVLPPGVPEVAPRVCPLPENEALDLAGPLAASAAAERTAVRRAVAFAPRTVSFTEEPLRTRNVGMLQAAISLDVPTLVYNSFTYADMPYIPATSLCSSTLTLQKVIRPGLDSAAASCSKMGEMTLHGPHQSA